MYVVRDFPAIKSVPRGTRLAVQLMACTRGVDQ
jgi:hypothetical protein